MNKRQKGIYYQRKIKNFYEKRGYLVHNQISIAFPVKVKDKIIWISKRNDIFGVFDGIAISPYGSLEFYQVSYRYSKSKKKEDFSKINEYLKSLVKNLSISFLLFECEKRKIICYEWNPEKECFEIKYEIGRRK